MKVTAVTKFKQGDLFLLLKKLNWTQSELARRSGLDQTTVGGVVNMTRRPSIRVANKICNAFGAAGEFIDVLALWPESFGGFERTPTTEETRDVDAECLLPYSSPRELTFEPTDKELLEKAIVSLDPRQAMVIEAGLSGKSYVDIADEFGCTTERVRQIEAAGVKRIKSYIHRSKNPTQMMRNGVVVEEYALD